MHKFHVMSISDMISVFPYLKGAVQIIVITRYRYRYNFKPLIMLDFDDVTLDNCPDGKKFVSEKHIKKIKDKLQEIKDAKLLFVCCDGGISRSPAVAKAIASYLGDVHSFRNLSSRYQFANSDVFAFVLHGLQEVKE